MTSPMTPQLEKIARAICRAMCEQDLIAGGFTVPTDPKRWESMAIRDYHVVLARAALSALLPPSEEIVEAIENAGIDAACNFHTLTYADAFTAAIQSILSEGEGT